MRCYILFLFPVLLLSTACSRPPAENHERFTMIDSLTDTYLQLEDSAGAAWNVIVWDETEKIKAMQELLEALDESESGKTDLTELHERLDKLEELHFDSKIMDNPHGVEEYDFASNSLTNEVVSKAEALKEYASSEKLQHLVDRIRIADQHIVIYRTDYDSAASRFNQFLDRYKDALQNLDADLSREKKVLF